MNFSAPHRNRWVFSFFMFSHFYRFPTPSKHRLPDGVERPFLNPNINRNPGKRWSIAIAATGVEEAEFNYSKEDILRYYHA